jgi:hypothetical protein
MGAGCAPEGRDAAVICHRTRARSLPTLRPQTVAGTSVSPPEREGSIILLPVRSRRRGIRPFWPMNVSERYRAARECRALPWPCSDVRTVLSYTGSAATRRRLSLCPVQTDTRGAIRATSLWPRTSSN